jgi:hypothetical protein
MFQEVSVAQLVRNFYLGQGVDASMDNIHLTIDMFQEVSVAKLVRDFYLGEGVDASMDNIHLTIDMFSDIVFWAGAHRYYQESFQLV